MKVGEKKKENYLYLKMTWFYTQKITKNLQKFYKRKKINSGQYTKQFISNEKSIKETKQTISSTIASKGIKYLEIFNLGGY